MSWRLLSWFWESDLAFSVAADATAELGAAAQLSVGITATIDAAIANELTAAASVALSSPPVALSIAADATDELSAAAQVASSIYFIPPAPGDPRVAVVTH